MKSTDLIDEVREEIRSDEGTVEKIYRDTEGYKTFGVGHLIRREDPEYGLPIGTPVSSLRVEEAFTEDLQIAYNSCVRLYGESFHNFPEEVQKILMNMMFNLGQGKLSKFVKMNDALRRRDWITAAAEGRDSRWYRQVTNRAERLMNRLEAVS